MQKRQSAAHGAKRRARRFGLLGLAAVVGVTAYNVLSAQRAAVSPRRRAGRRGERHVTKVVTINRPPDEVYRAWRRLEDLPRFMAHLESVSVLDDRRSHWVATGPAGATVEWDAEIIEDRPNERIAWRSLSGAEVDHAGAVEFTPAPGDRGTEVRVEMGYDAPGGRFGVGLAKLFGEEPGQQAEGDLQRFKQVMETGEVVHSDASIHRGLHPGQPASVDERRGEYR